MSVCEFAGCTTTLDEMCKKLWVPRGKIFHRTFLAFTEDNEKYISS